MDQIEKILRGLQDSMTVMEGLQRRQADRQQEHQQWLEDLNTAWSRHNAAWKRHEEWLQAHDRAVAEIDIELKSLIQAVNRFVQGRNGN